MKRNPRFFLANTSKLPMIGQPPGARHALAQLPPRSLTLGGSAGGQHHAGLSRPPSDAAITVNVPGQGGAENRLVHAVVMEQSSIVQGIAVYGDDMALEIARSGDLEQAAGSTGLSVMFGEAFEIPAVDYDWAERNGFDVARGLADAHAAQPRDEPPAAAGVGTGLHEAADTAFAEAALERPGTTRLAGNRRLKTRGHFQNPRPPSKPPAHFNTHGHSGQQPRAVHHQADRAGVRGCRRGFATASCATAGQGTRSAPTRR